MARKWNRNSRDKKWRVREVGRCEGSNCKKGINWKRRRRRS